MSRKNLHKQTNQNNPNNQELSEANETVNEVNGFECSESEYKYYADLKLLKESGSKLKEYAEKAISDFEQKTKDYEGLTAIRTETAFVNREVIIFIKGQPVPDSIEERLGDKIEKYLA